MEPQCVWASIYLICSTILYIALISKILYPLIEHGSWKTTLVDSLGVMMISSVQLIITSLQLIIIIIDRKSADWCSVNYFILEILTEWEIYILFSCLILMTANFHQKLIYLIFQDTLRQTSSCRQLIPGMGIPITAVVAIGLFQLANVGDLKNCHQDSQQLRNHVGLMFLLAFTALLILNLFVCYRCFSADQSVLVSIENSKLIPNLRKSVIGLCIQNISFVFLCFPLCVIQNHIEVMRTDVAKTFWIYCLKSMVLPLVWTVFPELIPYISLRNCRKKFNEDDVYLTTIYRDELLIKRQSMGDSRRNGENSQSTHLSPVNIFDEAYHGEDILNLDSHPEPFYESIKSINYIDMNIHREQDSCDQQSSDYVQSDPIQCTSAPHLHCDVTNSPTDWEGTDQLGRRSVTSVEYEYEKYEMENLSKQNSVTACSNTCSKIVDGYLIPVRIYETVV